MSEVPDTGAVEADGAADADGTAASVTRASAGDDSPAGPATGEHAPDLRRPRHRIERRAIRWWIVRAVISWGIVLAIMSVMAWRWDPARPWLITPIALAALWLLFKVGVEPWWRYRVHRWEITPEASYALTGCLVREWRVAPTSRIQTVDAIRGPLEQLFGLATLRITTASSSGAIDIVGLDNDVAQREADALAAVVEQTTGDAT